MENSILNETDNKRINEIICKEVIRKYLSIVDDKEFETNIEKYASSLKKISINILKALSTYDEENGIVTIHNSI